MSRTVIRATDDQPANRVVATIDTLDVDGELYISVDVREPLDAVSAAALARGLRNLALAVAVRALTA